MMLQPLVATALLLGQAVTPSPDCLTRQEAADMVVAFLPHLVDAASRRCRPQLQPNSFLVSRSGEWVQELRRDAAPRRESALRAFAKLGGGDMPPTPEGAGADMTFEFVAGMATAPIMQAIALESCADLDRLAESFRPLPADNIGRIFATIFGLVQAGQARSGSSAGADQESADREFPMICPA